jgi:hypothetical protein
MKVFLDDIRYPKMVYPYDEGWNHVKTVEEVINLLKQGQVTELSLDNDLGMTDPGHQGREVVDWMEETGIWPSRRCRVHSMNPVARSAMESVIRNSYLKMERSYEH